MSLVYRGMRGVDDLLSDVYYGGVEVDNKRTGVKTKAMFDAKVVIEAGDFPFVRNMASSPRLAFEELWFFLNGKTNTKELEDKNVFFWKGNTNKEFQESVGLGYLDEGELGSAYSNQWRSSGGYDVGAAMLSGLSLSTHYGVDQLQQLVDGLENDPYGRRHLVNLWNPSENKHGVLTPCWYSSQYIVLPCRVTGKDLLHVKLNNRSLDCPYGAKFAIQQYRLFQMTLCKWFGFELGRLSCDLSHVHIYENQYEYVEELLARKYEDPALSSIRLNKDISCLDDLLSLQWSDWSMEYHYNKKPFTTKRPEMTA